MSVDTRDKRFSLIGLAKPMVRCLQNPSGSIGQSGRQMLEFLYSGILASAPTHFNPAWAANCNVVVLIPQPTQVQR